MTSIAFAFILASILTFVAARDESSDIVDASQPWMGLYLVPGFLLFLGHAPLNAAVMTFRERQGAKRALKEEWLQSRAAGPR